MIPKMTGIYNSSVNDVCSKNPLITAIEFAQREFQGNEFSKNLEKGDVMFL